MKENFLAGFREDESDTNKAIFALEDLRVTLAEVEGSGNFVDMNRAVEKKTQIVSGHEVTHMVLQVDRIREKTAALKKLAQFLPDEIDEMSLPDGKPESYKEQGDGLLMIADLFLSAHDTDKERQVKSSVYIKEHVPKELKAEPEHESQEERE